LNVWKFICLIDFHLTFEEKYHLSTNSKLNITKRK